LGIEHRLFNGLIAWIRLPQLVQKRYLPLSQLTGGSVSGLQGRRPKRP
jgi:hypothetical protein